MTSNEGMDAAGEEEHDPIKLKSIKNKKTFTVPQNDRVRNNNKDILNKKHIFNKNQAAVTNICRNTSKEQLIMV